MKQRLLLNGDDKLDPSFLTRQNANALMQGLSDVGPIDNPLPTVAGGLGNTEFVAGQTLVFDGRRMISSGSGPTPSVTMTNDDRYYTKPQIDAMFAALANYPNATALRVHWGNVTGAPAMGAQMQFLDVPVTVYSNNTVMADPASAPAPTLATHVAKAVMVTCTGKVSQPDMSNPAILRCRMNGTSQWIDVGWFLAGGDGDKIAGCNGTIIPVDPDTQSFDYQLVCSGLATGVVCVNPGPVTLKIIGYLY